MLWCVKIGDVALHALLGVADRQFERGACAAHERRAHARIGHAQNAIRRITIGLGRHHHGVCGNLELVEENLALIECALSDFVGRLTFLDATFVQWHDENAAAEAAVAHVYGAEQRGRFSDCAVRNPGRLLPGDDELIAVAARDAIGRRERPPG